MPELSRTQLAVYAALAVAALMLGARWIRATDEGAPLGPVGQVGAEQGAADAGALEVEPGGGEVLVHVAGAVRKPGVYRMPADARVTDAIERAGGGTGEAALDSINLAARLADGQQVQVPASVQAPAGASADPAGGAASVAGAATSAGPISLGSATVADLDTIEGIGPVTATAIVEFRDERGGVASIDELDEVSGIGPATLELLRERLQP